MNCKEKEITELLPWFVNGTLSENERGKVKAHLESCKECQAAAAEIKAFSLQLEKEDKTLLLEHILPEKLVQYAEAKNELSSDDQQFIKAHLKTCPQCSRELALLKKVNISLREKQRQALFNKAKTKIDSLISYLHKQPALAYIIILLLLYPAYLGIFKKRQITGPFIAQQNYELLQLESRSSDEAVNEITLDSNIKSFSLSFNVPVVVDESIWYRAEILNSNKRVIWEKDEIKSLDEYGTFLIFCDSQFFNEGFYVLQISEINRADDRVQETFVFSFKVIKK